MQSLTASFTGQQQQESSELEEICDFCPKLSYKQRIIGFCVCCGFGYILSFAGTMILVSGGPNSETIRSFAALYIIGNFIAIAATLFLIGPKKQYVSFFFFKNIVSDFFFNVIFSFCWS